MPARTATKAAPARAASGSSAKPARSAAAAGDLVMTIDSDDDVGPGSDDEELALAGAAADEPDSAEEEVLAAIKGKKRLTAQLSKREKIRESVAGSSRAGAKGKGKADAPDGSGLAVSRDFEFDTEDAGYGTGAGWDLAVNGVKGSRELGAKLSVDDIIERRRKRLPEVLLPAPESEDEADAAGSASGEELESAEEDLEFAGFGDEDDESDEEGFGAGLRKARTAPAAEAEDDKSDEEDEEDEDDEDESAGSEDESASADSADEDSGEDESDQETEVQKARKAAYFAQEPEAAAKSGGAADDEAPSFAALGLSRPLLRALGAMGFHAPTPIQARSIPLSLAGKDIVAGAVTGSGKTAAFMIPVLERLAHRAKGRDEAKTRVVVLTPTRELAVQCHAVGKALGQFMDIRFCLAVGGLSVKAQEAELKLRPEVIIATPGRLIDHIRNSASFGIDDVEILIMDEADRMLEEGFAAELNEIVQATPKGRQTMLFSATMTDDVDELVRLSLRRPVRLFVDPKRTTAAKLIQEFVRVRGSGSAGSAAELTAGSSSSAGGRRTEDEARPALLLSLCTRTFRHQVIIFVRSKKLAHQLKIVFGLVGLSAAELHGDLSQEQRLLALQNFRDGKVDFLIATDLASRGLDIRGVQTVINYDMPAQFEQYLHRVGRTARAGRNGRAVTLVGEADRRLLKTALKRSPASQVKHRLIPPEVVSSMITQLDELKGEVEEVMKEEREEKAMRTAEMELTKGSNMIEHRDEIMSRPKRTWFQSEKDKLEAKNVSAADYAAKVDPKEAQKKRKADEAPKRGKFDGLSRKQKRSKMLREEIAEENLQPMVDASVRAAKKAHRPRAMGEPEPPKRADKTKTKKKRSSTSALKVGKQGGGFARDLGERSGEARSGGGGGGGGGARKKAGGGPLGGKPGKGGARSKGKSGRKR